MEQVFQPIPTGSSYLIAYLTGAVKGLTCSDACALSALTTSTPLRLVVSDLAEGGIVSQVFSSRQIQGGLSGGLDYRTGACVARVQPLTLWK